MKKNILLFIAVFSLSHLFAKNVTFSVNMTSQATKSALGIHVMGDFQSAAGLGADWTPNTCLMVQDPSDTNLYHFTVDIPAFTKYEYKYLNGDQSYEVEVVPLESQVGYNFDDNRWIYIDSLNSNTTMLAPLVFSANCPLGLNMVRFLVDMTTQPYNANGVHVAGNFQSNDPSTYRLYSFGNNVFELISYATPGTHFAYKYYNGNTSSDSEIVPTSCALAGDRVLNLTNDMVLPSVCFSSCSTCYPTSVTTQSFTSSVEIFPNPMTRQTSVRFNDLSQTHNIVLTDFAGRQIVKKLDIEEQVYNFGQSNLSKGVYTITIENDRKYRTSQKLIVE